jgi:hypothetical protein
MSIILKINFSKNKTKMNKIYTSLENNLNIKSDFHIQKDSESEDNKTESNKVILSGD